jgi:hypothetical protein
MPVSHLKYIAVSLSVIASLAFDAAALPKTKASQVTVDPSLISASTNTDVQTVLEDFDGQILPATTSKAGLVELATDEEAEAGVSTNKAITPAQLALSSAYKYLHIREERPADTEGSATAATWTNCTLNSEITDSIGSILTNNTFTLPPGTYQINATIPVYVIGNNGILRTRSALFNSSSIELLGSSLNNGSSVAQGNWQSFSFIRGIFAITTESTFSIKHISSGTFGYIGTAANLDSQPEIYTEVEIWKID